MFEVVVEEGSCFSACINNIHIHIELADEEIEHLFVVSSSQGKFDITQQKRAPEEMVVTPERTEMREQILAKLELAMFDCHLLIR